MNTDIGEWADSGRAESVVRVQGAGPDLRQGKGQHERLSLRQVQRKCYANVLKSR